MRKYLANSVLVVSMLFGSCSQPQDRQTQDPSPDVEVNEQSNHGFPAIELNNGAKWGANPETTKGIENMILIVEDFQELEDSSYGALSDELESEFILIFKNCTMKGATHDQLHNYLLPMRVFFKKLTSDDVEVRRTNLGLLKTHLSKYDMYFE